MDETGKKLLKLMFNEGETVCPHPNKYSYHSMPLANAMDGKITLVSRDPEQPIRYCDSSKLLLIGINPIEGFREDDSVTKFRSFLWEIDVGTIPQQLAYFKQLNVPISAQVFSGSKSVHAITVLDEDLPDEKYWRMLNEWALNVMTLCDQNCKNPSRSVRIPGALREPGKKQRLISIGNRITLKDFMDWLAPYEHLRPIPKAKRVRSGDGNPDRLSGWAKRQLDPNGPGINFRKGRNQTWYALAMDFALAGYSEDQAIDMLGEHYEEERDFKEREWLRTIRSAYEKVEGKS